MLYKTYDLEPVSVAKVFKKLSHFIWLDSSMQHEHYGRYSILSGEPLEIFCYNKNSFDSLKSALCKIQKEQIYDIPSDIQHLPFLGGCMGFCAYSLLHELENIIKSNTYTPLDTIDNMYFCMYDIVYIYDHFLKKGYLLSFNNNNSKFDTFQNLLNDAYVNTNIHIMHTNIHTYLQPILRWQSNFTKTQYENAIQKVIDYIHAGDIFQANIAQCFQANIPKDFDTFLYYLYLRSINSAPFAAYLDFNDLKIASASPERFLKVTDNYVEARPIKGTIKRSQNVEEDNYLKEQLKKSEKDKAENIMITDLLRNDLSKGCVADSIEVKDLCTIESYANVHHLVSVVTGKKQPQYDAIDILKQCFPGGSISGAPKKRAMEIIEEIENFPRKIYCGAIGYIDIRGNMDMNIAIRTVSFYRDNAYFYAGCGITAKSNPELEYNETLTKAQRLFKSFGVDKFDS